MSSWWNEDVPVVVRPGRTIKVKSPLKAAELLLDVRWPADPDLPKQRRARAAVLKALEAASDSKRSSAARTAFQAAVDEAGASGAQIDREAEAGAVSARWRKRTR
jgi:hypothetical protein